MSQTTDALTSVDGQIEYSDDGSNFTDISGYASKLVPSAQTRQTGVKYTTDGDTAIITAGKREPLEIEVDIAYTEDASSVYEAIEALFLDGDPIWLRWSPKGGAVGTEQFTTAKGYVTRMPPPKVDAEAAGPLAISFTVIAPSVTRATVVA